MSHTGSGAVGRVRGREDSMGWADKPLDPDPNDLLPSAGPDLAGKRSDGGSKLPTGSIHDHRRYTRMFLSLCVDVICLFR